MGVGLSPHLAQPGLQTGPGLGISQVEGNGEVFWGWGPRRAGMEVRACGACAVTRRQGSEVVGRVGGAGEILRWDGGLLEEAGLAHLPHYPREDPHCPLAAGCIPAGALFKGGSLWSEMSCNSAGPWRGSGP